MLEGLISEKGLNTPDVDTRTSTVRSAYKLAKATHMDSEEEAIEGEEAAIEGEQVLNLCKKMTQLTF